MRRLGERLKLHREIHGVSLRDIARKTGVSPATLSRLETSEKYSTKTLVKMANYLVLTKTEIADYVMEAQHDDS